MTDNPPPPGQKRSRIILAVLVVVALVLAAISVNTNLGIWRQNDAADAIAPPPA
jgi:predicted small secreted protein